MSRIAATRPLALALATAALVAACNGQTTELTTTSSLVGSTTSSPEMSTTTSTPPVEESTTSTLVGEVVGTYSIVARESETAGETLYVVIDPGTYTDVDIENFALDLVEEGTVTFGAEIFDDDAAVAAYRKAEADRSEDEQALIDEHHLASILNGSTLKFQGPFSDQGEFTIGS